MQNDVNEELTQEFKLAAHSLTQLFKHSKKSYSLGYAHAIRDTFSFFINNNQNHEALLSFLHEKLSSLDYLFENQQQQTHQQQLSEPQQQSNLVKEKNLHLNPSNFTFTSNISLPEIVNNDNGIHAIHFDIADDDVPYNCLSNKRKHSNYNNTLLHDNLNNQHLSLNNFSGSPMKKLKKKDDMTD
ncbi:hypothetical protein HDU92_005054 [Lobulomyces angularis]|nr:hypothetical protein HDU92_005054 [Lobulomyces angularis]